jgi:cell division protein FtsW
LASGLTLLAVLGLIAYLVPLDALSVVRSRFDNWLDPWPAASSSGFQTVQSLLALSAGGILGQGVGQGFPTYIPVVHSDFSFAAVAEEWGLIGTLSVIMCLAVWMQRALRLALTASRPFLSFLAAGIAALVAVQSLIIMGGVTRLFPLTGVTLPFLSYGGSSMAVSCMMMGLLLKLSGEAY